MINNYAIKLLKEKYIKYPNSIAIKKNNIAITYEKFWSDCNNFAFQITKIKKKPIVAIIGNHEYFDYVAIFGTLISGGIYVPINNDLPKSKIKKIIKLSKSNILSFNSTIKNIRGLKSIYTITENKINWNKKFNFFKSNFSKSNIAYIIFTSGSTGEPKGIKITKNNLDSYLKWLVKKIGAIKGTKTSQFPGIGFDLSVADIFATLCGGGTLVLPNKYYKIFPAQLLKNEKITHLICVPSLVNVIENSNQLKSNYFKSIKKIFFCGEPLYKDHLFKIFKANKNIKVINAYGPTEATVSCTSLDLNIDNYQSYAKYSMSIGKEIKGTKIYLLNKGKINNQEGEILISGKQVADGYIKDKINNKKKFIIFRNKKSFFTGDIGIYYKNNLYFKNRKDNQVKVRGLRVELDEINFYIRKIGYKNNYTIYYKDKIISFIQTKKINREIIINKLKKMTQNYMIPNEFIVIKKFPFNINGKIDKKALEKIVDEKK